MPRRWRGIGYRLLLAGVMLWAGPARADSGGVADDDAASRDSSSRTAAIEAHTEPQLRFFGAEHGINRQINDITLGPLGDLWLATMDGLARYDGRGFRFWRRVAGAPESLPDNSVSVLHADRAGTLWAATWTGLVAMDTRRQRLRRIRPAEADAACLDQITAMDSLDGTLWLATSRSVLCALRPDGTLHRVRMGQEPGGQPGVRGPIALLAESPHRLLLAGGFGLMRLHLAPDAATARVELLIDGATTDLGRDPDGTIWVGHVDGLLRIGADGRLTDAPWRLPDQGVMASVLPRQDGSYWIVASRALHRRTSQRDLSSLPALLRFDRGFVTGAEDQEGGLWLLTFEDGLAYLPPEHARFTLFAGHSGRAVRAVAVDADGTAWVAYDDGVGALSGAILSAARRRGNAAFLPVPLLKQPFSIVACAGALWLLDMGGVVRLDPGSGRAVRWLQVPAHRSHLRPEALECDRDGHLWTAQMGGNLSQYRSDGRLLRRFTGEALGIRDRQVYLRLQRAPDGTLWFAGTQDMLSWDGARLRRHPILPGEYVYALAFDGPETLWVARYGSLERYRLQSGVLRRLDVFDAADGLPAVEIADIAAADNGQLWLTTVRGLLQVDLHKRRTRLYSSEDGLPDSDFLSSALRPIGDGRALVVAPAGIVHFDMRHPPSEHRPPRLRWDALHLRRGEDDLEFNGDSTLRLLPGDRDLRIAVRLSTFSDPAGHQYAFRLHGYDPDWVHQDGEQLANAGGRVFSQLAPGRYTLDVRGRNAAGAWSTPLRLPIEVLPPWWRTGWATMLAVLAFAAAVLALALAQRRRLLRRHSYLLARQRRDLAEEASLAKSRFLADLGHELRTPMTGVLGMAELLQHSPLDGAQRGRVRAIRRAGEHLLWLVDEALDLARIEAGRLHLQHAPFSLRAVLAEVQALIAPRAEAKGLNFVVRIAPDAADARIGDAQRLRQVLLNLLGNAVKFTARGEVALEVAPVRMSAHAPEHARSPAPEHAQTHAQALRLHVRDTGPGMTAEQCTRLFRRFEQAEGACTAARYGGTGLGLAISRELVQAMCGEIAVDSAPGVGTDFVVLLPLAVDPSTAPVAGADGDGAALQAAAPAMLSADAGSAGNAALHCAAAQGMTAQGMTAPGSRDSERTTTLPALRVLLVEDDATVAEVFAGLLRLRGHRVTHAAHGLAALMDVAAMQSAGAAFDLALIDLDLPGIDGCTLAAQLRATGFTVPMLAITARADRDAEPQARAAGFDGFLRKPLSCDQLAEAMAALLAAPP